jgi:two-component system phosphate regulon sensor histidine kinase PhoR
MNRHLLNQVTNYLLLLLLGAVAAALFGITWGLALSLVLLIISNLYNARNLLDLNQWLRRHDLGSMPHSLGLWGQVFTQLHRLEKHSEQSQQKLRDALVRFQNAGAVLPNGVIVIDENDRILWCNPCAETHFGIRLEQDRDQSLTYLVRHPDFLHHLAGPTSAAPLLLKLDQPSKRTLAIQMVPYSNHERLLVSLDLSQMERDEQVRRDFVANVSHELRTPITVLGGFIETLLDNQQLDEATRNRILGTMQSQTHRMQELVEELLLLSRLESDQGTSTPEATSVDHLMRQVAQSAEHLSQGRHTIEVLIKDHDSILGSAKELLSAFGNLVSNAVRYTPDGGTIRLRWSREQGAGVFSVEDNGIGIEQEHIPRLTERFYRVDRARSRDTGGTGLGLAIVQRIATRHEANLEITSEPGKGSRFRVIFPEQRLTK